MLWRCRALCPDNSPMTDSLPLPPVLRRIESEETLFTKLSEFQVAACALSPIPPRLPAVLQAAAPAFQAGFAYTAAHWGGELTVTLHYKGAELGSSAPATPVSYSDCCAQLLAGLLGIPLADPDQAAEAEQPVAGGLRVVEPDPVEIESEAAQEPAAQEDPDEFEAVEPEPPAPAADIRRPLSDEEKDAAISMIKAMAADQRRTFTKVFREVFQVPPESKQVAPHILELQHLQFIDRYTVEAAGGIAA
jgi:hypothetical protein